MSHPRKTAFTKLKEKDAGYASIAKCCQFTKNSNVFMKFFIFELKKTEDQKLHNYSSFTKVILRFIC